MWRALFTVIMIIMPYTVLELRKQVKQIREGNTCPLPQMIIPAVAAVHKILKVILKEILKGYTNVF